MIDVHQLAEHLAIAADATQGGARDVHTVVTTSTADQFGLLRLAFQSPVGSSHFNRRISALRSRTREEHMIQIAGSKVGNPFCQPER
ncbi:hypothetical protein D3C75_1140540 [compost metagenome]